MEKLGVRIARLRLQRGWTQQSLADRIAMSRTAVSHIEADLATPSERTIVVLAGLFGHEPPALVAGTYYPPAKAARLPSLAARYTEVEKELLLWQAERQRLREWEAWLPTERRHATIQQWRTRLAAAHSHAADANERRLLSEALRQMD